MYELFNLKEAIHFGNSSQLLYISSLKFERDWNGMQHSHECTEIFFCLNGKGSFHIGGDTLSVTPYDFIIIAPGMKHAESSTSVSPLEYVVLGLSNLSFLLENETTGFHVGTFKEYSSFIPSLLTALITEVNNQPEQYQEVASNLLNLLLLYLKRISNLEISQKKTNSSSVPANQSSAWIKQYLDNNFTKDVNLDVLAEKFYLNKYTISQKKTNSSSVPANQSSAWIKQYLDNNFTKDVNLDVLAEKFYLNKYTIIHNFRKFYGTTPINYRLDRQFKEALFLLETTENTIRQISESLGFSSYNYFTQCFQKRFHMTPTEYRKKYKKEHEFIH